MKRVLHFSKRSIRWTVKLTLFAVTIVAIVWLAALAALRFYVVPNIEGFRPKLIEFLQSNVGRPIKIGGLEASWEGWNPRVVLRDVQLFDKDGRVGLRLPQVDQVISWRSLPTMTLTSRVLTIDGLAITVRRDANNRFSVGGMELAPNTESAADPRIADWFLSQREITLRNAKLVWQDDLRKAPPIALNELNAKLVNSGNRHRLGINAAWSDQVASPIQIVADMTGNRTGEFSDWSGQIYLHMSAADIARAKQWVTLPFPVQSGVGGLQAWLSFHKGKPIEAIADVRLKDVNARFAQGKPAFQLAALSGRMSWSEATSGGKLTSVKTENVIATLPSREQIGPLNLKGIVRQNVDGSFGKSEFELSDFDLSPIAKISPSMPMPEQWAMLLERLRPTGKIGKTTYVWSGAPEAPRTFELKTSFAQLGIDPTDSGAAIPKVAGINGSMQVSEKGGALDIASRNATINAPKLYAIPLQLDNLKTTAKWTRDGAATNVVVRTLEAANADASVSVSGTWRTGPDAPMPGVIDAAGRVDRAQADRVWAYLPLKIEAPVREYVRHAVKTGSVTGGEFKMRGALANFPYAHDEGGSWSLDLRASGLTLDYADAWPRIDNSTLALNFSGTTLSIDADAGTIRGVPIQDAKARIADMRVAHPQLSVVGVASGPTRDFLKFIDESPVAGWISRFTEGMAAEGVGQLNLALELPLGIAGPKAAVRGDYEFRDNALNLGPDIPVISHVKGKIAFTEQGISSRDLLGTVFGGPASFTVGRQTAGVGIAARGVASVDALKAAYPSPLLDKVRGQLDWTFDTNTAAGGEFKVTSTLTDVALALPAPFGKPSGQPRAFQLTRRYQSRDELVDVKYGEDVAIALRLGAQSGKRQVVAAGFGIGVAAELPNNSATHVIIRQPEVSVERWLALRDELLGPSTSVAQLGTSSTKSLPPELAGLPSVGLVRVDSPRVVSDALTLSNAVLTMRPLKDDWLFDVRSDQTDGRITWRPNVPDANGTVVARLSKLIVGTRRGSTSMANAIETKLPAKPRSAWPKLDLAVDNFTLRGNALGKMEVEAIPTTTGWEIGKLHVTNDDADLTAKGKWSTGVGEQTTIVSDLAISNAPKFFARLGLGEAIRDTKGKIEGVMSWPGSPADFDLRAVNGDFTLDFSAGRFTKAEPGIAKLLGIVSLQSIGRRLAFDYRDLFSEGFSFDSAKANVKLQSGTLRTENLDILGPTAKVEIRGSASLPDETQSLDVRVIPDISTSMAVGAGIATANPLVGAGVLLASKVLKDPLGKAVSVHMKITGTWDDPKVEGAERTIAATRRDNTNGN